MEITLICVSKREHIQHGGRIYSIEFTNPENLEDGILDATFHIETLDPGLAERFAINESYHFQIPDGSEAGR